ncbi:MAG: hypothetical protein VXZ13_08565, partial [Pseudomonadota bacterium]|nr:hypothetical protein [Pseudomonadota bacterium]
GGVTILNTNNAGTFTIKDSATTLAANTSLINGKAVVIDDTGAVAATVQELNAIQAVASSVTYTKLRDTSQAIRDNVDENNAITDIDGIAVTVTDSSNVSQYTSILTAAGAGSVAGAVADTAAALATTQNVTLTGATSVTAVISTANDLVSVQLDTEVTAIDIGTNSVTNVLLDIEDLKNGNNANRTISNTGGGGSYKIKDTATILAANDSFLEGQTVIINDSSTAATTTEVNTIQAGIEANGASGALTYTKLTGTATSLAANTDDIIDGVAVTIDESGAASTYATVAQIDTLTTRIGAVSNASLSYEKLNDSATLLAAGTTSYLAGKAITIDDSNNTAATTSELNTIQTKMGESGSVSYAKLKDTATLLAANTADIVDNVAVTIDETGQNTPADTAEINSLQTAVAAVNGASLTYTKVSDTSQNLRANTGDLEGKTVTVSDSSSVSQYNTLISAVTAN